MMWWYGGMPGWGALMMVGTGLTLVAVLVLAVFMAVRLRRADPRRLLAERFARGEIDEQEYRHGLDVLGEPLGPVR
jgi:putative membrane protein